MTHTLAERMADDQFAGYAYAYPHKTSYRPLEPPVGLSDAWQLENLAVDNWQESTPQVWTQTVTATSSTLWIAASPATTYGDVSAVDPNPIINAVIVTEILEPSSLPADDDGSSHSLEKDDRFVLHQPPTIALPTFGDTVTLFPARYSAFLRSEFHFINLERNGQ